MTAHMIDGHVLAAKLLSRARTISRQLARKPRLAVVSGADAAARSYLKALLTAGPLAGVDVVIHRLHGGSRAQTLGLLSDICSDSTVDAVIVETPYPKHLSFQDIADALPADKDAEGITPECYGLLFQAKTWSQVKNLIVPSTALAVAHLAQSLGPVAGQQAVVIGRSDTVGRPSAHLLSSLDMTVTLAHSRTKNLAALCRHADVLVAAAGVAGLVNADWIKPGALVIDVGVHSSRKGTVGDVAARADQFAKAITCVPGGVGPVATAITLLQTSVLARDNGNRVAARKSP